MKHREAPRTAVGRLIEPICLPFSRKAVVAAFCTALTAGPAAGQLYGLDARPVVGSFLDGALPPVEQRVSGWEADVAFPGLTFEDPTVLVPEPGGNRLYVGQRQGAIYFFANEPATSSKTLFLDLTAVTQGYNDCGLLGLAFHPRYGVTNSPHRGYVYVYYQYSPSPTTQAANVTPAYNRLSRFTVPDGSLLADPASETVLINQFDRHLWHNGGGMFFGSDGFLYLSLGDEGAANDSYDQTQEIGESLFSGVVRIDVDMDPARSHPIRRQPQNPATPPGGWPDSFATAYYIPDDNPWQDEGGSLLEEFYAIGLRSPHRMTYDAPSGRIWLGDVGQNTREEVNLIERGGNYQWAYMEGSVAGPKTKPVPLIGTDQPPIHDYPRSEGNAVIGGYVYHGSEHAPFLSGRYIFGDNGSGRIWAMTYDGVGAPVVEYLSSMPGVGDEGLATFGLDQGGEIYMLPVGPGARIYKLSQTGGAATPPPPLLSQTGVFTNLNALVPNGALIPYDVMSPLWSDAADKWRWMAVPNNGPPYDSTETVDFSATGGWTWPTGTVFVKHFELSTNETSVTDLKRLETRVLAHGTNGFWYGLTYKWRDDHSDADLLLDSLLETNLVTTVSGVRTQVWYYPSRQDCMVCHNSAADRVLGPRTCQMNGDVTYPSTGRTDNQIRALNHIGLFSTALSETNIPALPRAVPLDDVLAPYELRVRSYLDSNCAHCHRPGGVHASFDVRFDTPLGLQNIVNGPVGNPLGIADARVVKPLSPSQSIMHVRMNSEDATIQMPPLARNLVHPEAVAVVTAWINSLPATGIPWPWSNGDVGPVQVAGNAEHFDGSFTVLGSGVDIWAGEDSFHFVYRPLVGDAELTARVASQANTDPWALAGVMIREQLTGGSRHAMVGLTPENGVSFTRRTVPSASSDYTAGSSAGGPFWVRMVRSGSTFTAYDSPNGTNWTVVGSATVSMSGTVYAGLALTSHDNAVLGSAVFDNVLLLGPNVNNAPSVTPDQLVRYMTQGVQVESSVLVANDMDVDGDVLSLADVMTPSEKGGSVTGEGSTVYYWPAYGAAQPDLFRYVITDGRGGLATGPVTVLVQDDPPVNEVLQLDQGGGSYTSRFTGIPGFTYTLQYSDSMYPTDWQYLATAVADEFGQVEIVGPAASNVTERYYRSVRGLLP